MTEQVVTGVVESLRKDRKGLKLDDNKWYGGWEGELKLNKGDEVELILDDEFLDDYDKPSIVAAKRLKAAPKPQFSGNGQASWKGNGTAGAKPKSAWQPSKGDPETQDRISRSHAVTLANSILERTGGDLNKAKVELAKVVELSQMVKDFTTSGTFDFPTTKAKSATKTKPNLELDD